MRGRITFFGGDMRVIFYICYCVGFGYLFSFVMELVLDVL